METKEHTPPLTFGSVPICRSCGSEHVAKDAFACFNRNSGLWELENVYDAGHCHQCGGPTKLDWISADAVENRRIQVLNDRFRVEGLGNGTVLLTQGIEKAGQAFVLATVDAVRSFSGFSEANDPWGEHDFGSVEIEGQKVFFKLDYYDPSMSQGSENPANEALTHRVLTIMLASEY